MPRVLNIRTCPGRKAPDGAVYIGRAFTRGRYRLVESRWKNPFEIVRDGTRAEVIAKHRAWLCDQADLMAALPELRGHDLVCWCAPDACHGDTLIQMANARDYD